MKLKNFSLVGGLAGMLLILGSTSKAQALDWGFSYSSNNPRQFVQATGIITTADITNVDGSYQITSVTGQRNGVTFNTLLAPMTIEEYILDTNDNRLYIGNYEAGGLAFRGGFAFEDSQGEQYQFGGLPNGSSYSDYLPDTGTSIRIDKATFTIVQVPFDFSSGQGVLLGLPLFFSLRMLKKGKASKLIESKAFAASTTSK